MISNSKTGTPKTEVPPKTDNKLPANKTKVNATETKTVLPKPKPASSITTAGNKVTAPSTVKGSVPDLKKTGSSSSMVTSTSRTTATKGPTVKNGPSTIKTPGRLSKTNSVA